MGGHQVNTFALRIDHRNLVESGECRIDEIELPCGAIISDFTCGWRDEMSLVDREPYSWGASRGTEWEHSVSLAYVRIAGRQFGREHVKQWWGEPAVEALDQRLEGIRLGELGE